MNLCIYPTAFANEFLQIIDTMQKLSLFSKDGAIVQSYANHVARIIELTNTSQRKAGKHQLEIIFQLQIVRDMSL